MLLPLQALTSVPIEEMPDLPKAKTQKKVKPKKGKPKKLILPKPIEVNEIEETPKDIIDVLYPEEFGETVSGAVVGLANRIDSFFGDARSDDERNGSTLRIIPSYTLFSNQPAVSELGFNLNLKLINLE